MIPEEEAEWVGLSLEEAVEKQRLLEHKVMDRGMKGPGTGSVLSDCIVCFHISSQEPTPLFLKCVDDLVHEFAVQKLSEPKVVGK